MAKGIIYVMSTVVPGLVKIGKTATSNFESRMYQLEHNGYFNVVGLQRRFAIEVESYDEKEDLLDEIFSKSRVYNSELFSLDIELVIQLLSSFEGRQVYPEVQVESKEEAFKKAEEERKEHVNSMLVPNGTYHLVHCQKFKGNKNISAQMEVEEGRFVVREGQLVSTTEGVGLSAGLKQMRAANIDANGRVLSDVSFDSPSAAASFVLGAPYNGWTKWKTPEGKKLEVYKQR